MLGTHVFRIALLLAFQMLALACRSRQAAAQAHVVTCESLDGQRKHCYLGSRVDRAAVRLLAVHGDRPCRKGADWNAYDRGVWVDHGCRADFEYAVGSGRTTEEGGDVPAVFVRENGEVEVTFPNNCVVYFDSTGRRSRKLSECTSSQVRAAEDAVARHLRTPGR